jgi:glycosyltransferase involved in cell wall biosynthesis
VWILQICHSYYPPFLDCARQYSALFNNTPYKVLTVYLTGAEDAAVARDTCSDEVVFLGYSSGQVRGLKIAAIRQIKKIVTKHDFKLCIAHRVKPTYVALLGTKLPVISVHHNYNDYTRWSRRPLVNFYKNRMLMLGVSDSVRDDLRRDLTGWQVERIQTLYNRINVAATKAKLLTRLEARQQLQLPADAWILGTAGRLHHDKDYPTLLRGFAAALPDLLPKSQLIIMGKGPLERELKELSLQLGIAEYVKFLGHVPNGASYFSAFDAFALTSDHEPFGMVLLEAMAAEVPVICSDCGGGAEVVRGVGHLFRFGDYDDLKAVILNVQHSEQQKISTEKLIKQFSDESVKAHFFALDFVKKALQ